MVTNLISTLNQGFQEIIFPRFSPQQASPGSPRKFFPSREKNFFMDFSCMNEPVGRIIIKTLEEANQAAVEFEYLMTGQEGFGYKGSRVYACCKDEWCLLGDLLYEEPQTQRGENIEWDPRMPEGNKQEEDEGGGGEEEEPLYRKLYLGSRRVIRGQVLTRQPDTRGAVVAVASDYDLETRTWTLGPQIKICLSDSLLRSGRVLGTVTEGMEVVHQLSRMGAGSYDPRERITISDCGTL